MTSLLDRLGDLPLLVLVLLAFAFAWAEAAVGLDVVVPGEVALVLIGAAVRDDGGVLVPVVLVAAIGAVVGDSTSFALGRYGTPLLERLDWARRRIERSRGRAAIFFERHGGVAVAAARWIGALRAVVPFVAGSSRGMPYGRFLLWDSASALPWAATIVTLGFVLGDDVAEIVDSLGWWAAAVVAAAVVIFLLVRRVRAGRAGDAGEGAGEEVS